MFLLTKSCEIQLPVRLGYENHVKTISISIYFLAVLTEKLTILTRNNIAIFNHLSLNTSIFSLIKATDNYLCLSFCPLVYSRKFLDVPLEQHTDISFWSLFPYLPCSGLTRFQRYLTPIILTTLPKKQCGSHVIKLMSLKPKSALHLKTDICAMEATMFIYQIIC